MRMSFSMHSLAIFRTSEFVDERAGSARDRLDRREPLPAADFPCTSGASISRPSPAREGSGAASRAGRRSPARRALDPAMTCAGAFPRTARSPSRASAPASSFSSPRSPSHLREPFRPRLRPSEARARTPPRRHIAVRRLGERLVDEDRRASRGRAAGTRSLPASRGRRRRSSRGSGVSGLLPVMLRSRGALRTVVMIPCIDADHPLRLGIVERRVELRVRARS